ncbi:cadmium-translocating P-type ATPase [Pseudooceanicola sp. CBS1P-1]|uniref:Cadmium-translocating P-type ATPase n=1 Tax=Pseudooceanicola albus TaxID=2692189 RepID=A0A6L7GAS7_9RHOB|nr:MULTISPECIES: heavy metal translocating P-type ATPase [Pseudooceanicola]MBT9386376.1 cadmium-translocating P-type ATPase [Pseudooceanicola endophyticus]MXN20466.1 cadmium-translocating P-type ATPase [Pseudooceanicola albus]
MSTAQISACPACAAAPAAEELAGKALKDATLALSLPGIHCAACIDTVEQALNAQPGVKEARVNLTLKRAMIRAEPGLEAEPLVQAVRAAGYEAHELDAGTIAATATDRAGRDLLMRLAVAGFASMNVMLLSVSVWSGAEDATRDMFHWISAAITFPAIAFCAQPFFRNAFRALSVGRLNMDVPISLAILLALATSLWETMLSGEQAYFDAALTLTFFLLAGRYLDHRTRAVARSAAEELAALEVPRATRLAAGREEVVAVSDLAIGDLLLVRPGARMPVDGVITEGRSELDRSLLTGETRPVAAEPGQAVSAGEVNLTGPLTLRATAVGRDTSLARMAELVAIAESGRARYTSLADRAAKLYAPGVHILSALAFAGWYFGTGDLRVALNIAAAVLIITCPCALGLAVPAVTTAASGRLFRRGLLIKHETALERLAEVDTVVFDKTGTLTSGDLQPQDLEGRDPQALSVALALAEGSAHPLSRALAHALRGRGVTPAGLSDLRERPGYGTEGWLNGQLCRLGRASWLGAPAETEQTATWLAIGAGPAQAFPFTDSLRAGAEEAVRALQADGKRVILISGDSRAAVQALAGRLGISEWQAGALPGDKAARITELQAAGARVLMVGDGLNDTAALSSAHASISPSSALDAARVASDVVLLGGDLSPIPVSLRTATRATRRIRENFRIATVYNVVAVPLAVAGICSPLIAALAMSASSVTVSLNALRLR